VHDFEDPMLEFVESFDKKVAKLEDPSFRRTNLYLTKWQSFLEAMVKVLKEFNTEDLLNLPYHLISSGSAHLFMRLVMFELAMRGKLIADYELGVALDSRSGSVSVSFLCVPQKLLGTVDVDDDVSASKEVSKPADSNLVVQGELLLD